MLEALIHATRKFTNVSDSGQYNSEKSTLDGKIKGATYSMISPNSMLSSSAAKSDVAVFCLAAITNSCVTLMRHPTICVEVRTRHELEEETCHRLVTKAGKLEVRTVRTHIPV